VCGIYVGRHSNLQEKVFRTPKFARKTPNNTPMALVYNYLLYKKKDLLQESGVKVLTF
jgi:hypothetical protein